MNTKINNKRRRSSSHYFIFSFIFLFSIIAHQFYKQYLYSLSNDYVQIIQNEIKVRCPFYKTIFFLFSYIVNYKVLILAIIVFMYNFGNIFKTYILLLTLEIAMISSSVFKLIYREYKPYWNFFINDTKSNVTYINIANTTELYSTNKTNDVFYISTNGFGGPSTNVLITAVLLFTVWRVIFKSMRLKEKGCFYKNIVLFIVFIYTLIESFLYWICYESSLDQIAFSFSLAFCIYFFIFYVLNLYSNDIDIRMNVICKIFDFDLNGIVNVDDVTLIFAQFYVLGDDNDMSTFSDIKEIIHKDLTPRKKMTTSSFKEIMNNYNPDALYLFCFYLNLYCPFTEEQINYFIEPKTQTGLRKDSMNHTGIVSNSSIKVIEGKNYFSSLIGEKKVKRTKVNAEPTHKLTSYFKRKYNIIIEQIDIVNNNNEYKDLGPQNENEDSQ